MLAGVSARSLPTEPPIVKLQYSSARVEVTNCVRRTCCYEYYIKLMQSGSVILVSGTRRRRAQDRQSQSCPWASLTHYLSSVSLSSLVHLISLSPSLFLSLSSSLSHLLPFCLSAWFLHCFPSTSGWQGSLCCFCSLPPPSLQAPAISKTR